MKPRLALFDFDNTLIRNNSLPLLFAATNRCGPIWFELLAVAGSRRLYRSPRTAVKHRLYARCLVGCDAEEIYAIGERIATRFTANRAVLRALEEAKTQGVAAWVVTAAPRAFVEGIIAAMGWPVERVIGTELPTDVQGAYTGEPPNECIGGEKVRRVREAIARLGYHEEPVVLVAYGNAPADLPLLALAKRGYVVRHGRIRIRPARPRM